MQSKSFKINLAYLRKELSATVLSEHTMSINTDLGSSSGGEEERRGGSSVSNHGLFCKGWKRFMDPWFFILLELSVAEMPSWQLLRRRFESIDWFAKRKIHIGTAEPTTAHLCKMELCWLMQLLMGCHGNYLFPSFGNTCTFNKILYVIIWFRHH